MSPHSSHSTRRQPTNISSTVFPHFYFFPSLFLLCLFLYLLRGAVIVVDNHRWEYLAGPNNTGERSDLSVNLVKTLNGHVHNKMLMSKNGTQFNGIAEFDLRDPTTNEVIFTTHRPTYNMPAGTNNLVAKVISTSGVRAAINDDLILNTTQHKKLTNKISIRGSEGVQMNGEELILDADNVEMTTHNGSIVLTNSKGIYLNMKRIPLVPERSGIKIDEKQYKICVCMPEGRLFRVAMPTKNTVKDVCSYANLQTDPCI